MITPLCRLAFGLVATVSLSSPSARAENSDGVLIVQLAHLATAGKCAQAGLEFTAADLTPIQDYLRADDKIRDLSEKDRTQLWQLALGLSEQHVAADTCKKARTKLETWFPEAALR
jgi:hypothetical protein